MLFVPVDLSTIRFDFLLQLGVLPPFLHIFIVIKSDWYILSASGDIKKVTKINT